MSVKFGGWVLVVEGGLHRVVATKEISGEEERGNEGGAEEEQALEGASAASSKIDHTKAE
jgi:hypothetical protein